MLVDEKENSIKTNLCASFRESQVVNMTYFLE